MTRIDTDQRKNEAKESVPPDQRCWFPIGGIRDICVICGPKQTELREEKVFAGFDPTGHSGIHIQSLVSIPFRAPRCTGC